jgi:MFS family permease
MTQLTLYNFVTSIFVAFGSGSYGYAFAVFPTSTGQPGFLRYFDLNSRRLPPQELPASLPANHNQIMTAILPSRLLHDPPQKPHLTSIILIQFSILGAINALFNLGLALGALAQGWLADTLGRKRAFEIAAICALLGAALVTGSVAIGMLIAVRLLHGFGLGMLVGLVPLYIAETAPPLHRGLLLCINTTCISMGYFVSVTMNRISSFSF